MTDQLRTPAVSVVAADLGSSSGRVMVGRFDGAVLTLHEQHRFPIQVQAAGSSLHWDVPAIVAGIREGIAAAGAANTLDSVAVDTWGVDHVLLDDDGAQVGPVHAYRDPRTTRVADELAARAPDTELWRLTGIQPQQINTSHQLFATLRERPDLTARIAQVVMLPDYISHVLGGEVGWSRGICSTSGLAAPGAHEWSTQAMSLLGIDPAWFGPISAERSVVGTLAGTTTALVRAGSHDTACAVHALAPRDEARVFLSAGSWSLLGVEVDEPLLGEEFRRSGFTNEARTDGGVRLLKNITGLWILQECQRQWAREGRSSDVATLVEAARAARPLGGVFDPDHEDFLQPGPMADRVASHLERQHGAAPADRGEVVRTVLESQAVAYARHVEQLAALTGARPAHLAMVGGGTRNRLLVEMTAAACQLPVVVGPAEASATGSVVAQLEALGHLAGADEVRAVLADAAPGTTVLPEDVPELSYLTGLAHP